MSVPAAAQTSRPSLSTALSQLARDAHIELLFDERLTAGRLAPRARKGGDPERRLRFLLAGTGLTFRRTGNGTYVVLVGPVASRVGTPPPQSPEPPVADILVIGRRTLNADIRRGRNDIQRYDVLEAADIERSQSATLDTFLRTDFVDNRQFRSLGQTPFVSEASVRSQVDVHGLGADQTLLLVDGRRLPRIVSVGAFLQPDVNALPLQSIDRIETIGTTAGGIFGIGAAGGAVNVVTKGEYDDVSAASRFGVSDRGDAVERGANLHVGLTSRNGRTRFSARIGANRSDGLAFGDRPYVADAFRLAVARDPSVNLLPVSDGINISGGGSKLTFLPAYGGATLASSTTFLPLDAPAVGSGGAALLVANSGRTDFALSPDGQGSLQTMLTPARSASVQLNARQEVGDDLVVYFDYLRLSSAGRITIPGVGTLSTYLVPGRSGNPFAQAIFVSFPTVGLLGGTRNRTVTGRLTAGAIYDLGRGWSASVDAAAGRATMETTYDQAPVRADAIDVFAGGEALKAQLASIGIQRSSSALTANRLHDLNLKLAGSPFSLPAGRAYLTMTGEVREEASPGEIDRDYPTSAGPGSVTMVGALRERVSSGFVELRAPVFSGDGGIRPLRGLEVQLAVRHDRYAITAPVRSAALIATGRFGAEVTSRGNVTAITAGFRVRPIHGLTLRGSYATGYTPPTAAQIVPDGLNYLTYFLPDPKRGGTPALSSDRTFLVTGGSPSLKPQLARTLSLGAIGEPAFAPGLRLSIDYSRLRTLREIGDYSAFTTQYFIDHEDEYPGRVVRAPVSAADIAKGFTIGRITLVDSTYLTVGRSTLEVVDVAIEYTRHSSLGGLRLFGKGSWEPRLARQGDPGLPAYNAVDSVVGPLAIRVNAGLDWNRGPWSAGVSGQAYGAYRVTYSFQSGSALETGYVGLNRTALIEQGGDTIPAQAYLDAYVGWRRRISFLSGVGPELSFRLGMKNLLGTDPPQVVPAVGQSFYSLGYSYYGDPRGRRFVLDLSARF